MAAVVLRPDKVCLDGKGVHKYFLAPDRTEQDYQDLKCEKIFQFDQQST